MASAYETAVWLGNIIDDWNGILAEGAERSRELMVDLNKEQLQEGMRSDSTSITPKYSRFTVIAKQQKGQPTFPTLRDTGEFYSKFYLKLAGDKFGIDSADWKRDELVNKYKPQIFGLTSESRRILWVEQLRQEIINIINSTR